MSGNVIKIISMAATVLGMGASLITEWADGKKLDSKIDEKVNEAVKKAMELKTDES